MNYLVHSFIAILIRVSGNTLVCDEQTTIEELFSDDFDSVDFELAKCAFEATHKVLFIEPSDEAESEEYLKYTVEDYIERCIDTTEQTDPMFVTERFLIFQEALEDALNESDDFDRP
ncbi:MAG TPA: hypothetical protein VIT91_01060 [Chthoniobacterales bacterium]